jgi:hypothetical protein
MIGDILEQKLEGIGLVKGVDLFRGFIPSEVSIAVMTREPLDGIQIDPYISGRYKGDMQVIVRHTDPEAGVALARSVWKALDQRHRELFPATSERGEVHLDQFIPRTLPIQYPRLDGNTIEWSQTFSMVFGVKETP